MSPTERSLTWNSARRGQRLVRYVNVATDGDQIQVLRAHPGCPRAETPSPALSESGAVSPTSAAELDDTLIVLLPSDR